MKRQQRRQAKRIAERTLARAEEERKAPPRPTLNRETRRRLAAELRAITPRRKRKWRRAPDGIRSHPTIARRIIEKPLTPEGIDD